MSEQSSTTVKFGAGYDVPMDTVRGTVEERRQEIAEAAGLELGNKTLYQIAVEASLKAHALVNAATIGKKPAAKEAPAKSEGTQKESIADKAAKNATPSGNKPAPQKKAPAKRASSKKADPIADAIAQAGSDDELVKLWKQHKNAGWTSAHDELVKARITELKEAAA